MSTTLHRRRTRGARLLAAVGTLALGVTMTACSSDTESNEDASTPATDSSESSGEWPRTVETADGPVTLDAQPERIVSTSVTLTGTLLALDAPLYGTAAQPPSTVTDDDGLFTQWADVAAERDVEILYQASRASRRSPPRHRTSSSSRPAAPIPHSIRSNFSPRSRPPSSTTTRTSRGRT